MIEKRILIAEDDITTLKLIESLLKANGCNPVIAENGKEALDLFNEKPFEVVITDIEMPVMDGNELINTLSGTMFPPVIFVTTTRKDPDMIIDIMKKGVYDYLIKPIDLSELQIKISRAFEAAKMKRSIAVMEKEKVIRLENQLEWYKWMERSADKNKSSAKDSLFANLQTSFNQGAGFGALITMLNMLSSAAEKEGDKYLIDSQMFDLIMENNKMAEKAIKAFSDIEHIIHKTIHFEETSYDDFYNFINLIIKDSKQYADINGHEVIINDVEPRLSNFKIKISKTHIYKTIFEILINAYKFSVKNSSIILILNYSAGFLTLSCLNNPSMDSDGREGIPMEYENIVFEPFFRMTKNTHEQYKTLDFGLGLTLIEKIAARHNGKCSIGNIMDHSNLKKGPELKVHLKLSIPVI